jgi:hypothetical protein
MKTIARYIGYSVPMWAALSAMDAGEDVIAYLCFLLAAVYAEAELTARLRAIDE